MNDREKCFCGEYLIDLNASGAATRAGYAPTTARNAASWIHPLHPTKPALREEIDRLLAERSRRTGVNADRVVRELARIAFSDMTDVLDVNAADMREAISRDDSAAVAKIRRRQTSSGVECEVRMYDKNRALELLGRHLGLFANGAHTEMQLPLIVDDTGTAPDEQDRAPEVRDPAGEE